MAIKALLLDRDREVFPLLGDIFNVTGHKLLIATNEDMFKDLVNSTDLDVVIVNHTDVKSWLSSWKEGNIPLPFFLLDREEEELRFRNIGFSDLNYIKKPFNPLELLNKLNYLYRLKAEEDSQQLGLINTVIKLSNERESKLVEVSNSNYCAIAVEEGRVLGMDCTVEELKTILESEDPKVRVKDFERIKFEQKFGDTFDFVKTLIERTKPVQVVITAGERALEEVKPVEEIDEGIYRVSRFSSVPVLLKNVYLRIYEGKGRRAAFLINVGSLDEWSGVRNLVEDTLLNLEELDAVILLTGELSSIYNSFILSEHKFNTRFITDYSVKRELAESGCKSGRIRTFADFPSYTVTIATGHKLRFIPVNFSPSLGGFCLYEEDTGYLFTPELFSSFFNEQSKDITEEVRLYHRIFMPSGGILNSLMGRFNDVRVRKVLPRYGLSYGEFEEVREKLSGLRAGMDFSNVSSIDKALEIMNEVVSFVMDSEEKSVSDKFIEEVGRFATVEAGVVTDIYVDPPFTVELLLNALILVPGIKPSTVVGVLSRLDRAEIFINPF
ncbi:oxygen-binding di-iron domain-containing protein [Hydrogenivirga sp.]